MVGVAGIEVDGAGVVSRIGGGGRSIMGRRGARGAGSEAPPRWASHSNALSMDSSARLTLLAGVAEGPITSSTAAVRPGGKLAIK